MKNNGNESKLRQLLDSWEVNPAPAPGFKAEVWERIAAAEQRAAVGPWRVVREWLLVQLPRPAYASVFLGLIAAGGFVAASKRAEEAHRQYRLDSARQYLASIDPIAMSEHVSPHGR